MKKFWIFIFIFFLLFNFHLRIQAMRSKYPQEVFGQISRFLETEPIAIHISKVLKPYRTLKGHTGTVSSAQFYNHDTKVLTTSWDKTICVWDVKTKESTCIFKHNCSLGGAHLNHDETEIAITLGFHKAGILNIQTGKLIRILEGHTAYVSSAKFNHKGTKIVTAAGADRPCPRSDFTARIWDNTTALCDKMIKGHKGRVNNASFNYDSTKIITASDDYTARIWNAKTGQCTNLFEGHTGRVLSAHFNHDETQAITTSWDKSIRIWNTKTNKCLRSIKGYNHFIDAKFNHDSTLILAVDTHGDVTIYNPKTGRVLFVLLGHNNSVTSIQFNRNNTQALTASHDQTICVWNIKNSSKKKKALWLFRNKLSPILALVLKNLWKKDQQKCARKSQTPTIKITKSEDAVSLANLEKNEQSQKVYQLLHDYLDIKYNVMIDSWEDVKLLGTCLPYQHKRMNLKMSQKFAQEYNSAKNKLLKK